MGIHKLKVLPSGVSGSFWLIKGIYVSPDLNGVRAYADLYLDQPASTSGTPLYSEDILLSNSDNPLGSHALVRLVEQKLISMPGDFVSGTQV